ncbi:unnamed protein product [Ambrosiozyma monospora]|uniref:Unnamed protein product n=1 Tax=Ambrosiozyma monospora TaxID=43982 RepID=A0ACB5UBX5_AMBMO|nr:unnamed protein product [Ambrosiozyma monospora]
MVLKELSSKTFNENDVSGPKSISVFLSSLAHDSPRLVMRQVSLVEAFLDNGSTTVRCGALEAVSHMLSALTDNEEDYNTSQELVTTFIHHLEERVLDTSPFVRSRAFRGLKDLMSNKAGIKFTDKRLRWTKLSVRHMQDRSNLVRKSALALLSELVTEHPYNAIGDGTLRMTVWKQRLQVIKDEITELEPNFFSDDVDETANPMNETMAEEEQNVEGESEGDGDADKSTNEGQYGSSTW